MTNFKSLLKVNYSVKDIDNEKIDEAVISNYDAKMSFLHRNIENTVNHKLFQMFDGANGGAISQIIDDGYTEPTMVAYYYWIYYLYHTIGKEFLSSANSRHAYEELDVSHEEGVKNRKMEGEKPAIDLLRKFYKLMGDKAVDNFSDLELLTPYINNFTRILEEKGKDPDSIEELRKVIIDRLKVPEKVVAPKKEPEKPKENMVETNPKKEQPAASKKVPTLKKPELSIPSFFFDPRRELGQQAETRRIRTDVEHIVSINGLKYGIKESEFSPEIRKNPNLLYYNILKTVYRAYRQEINENKPVPKSQGLISRIQNFFKSLRLEKLDFEFDQYEFSVSEAEISRYATSHGYDHDMIMFAFGKLKNAIAYPRKEFTERNYYDLTHGYSITIRKADKEYGPYQVYDYELEPGKDKTTAVYSLAYKKFEEQKKKEDERRRFFVPQDERKVINLEDYRQAPKKGDSGRKGRGDIGDI